MFFTFKKRKININGKLIGYEFPTFIIAEIGINHNGDINIAKKLIDEAIKCGVDAVKFQSYKTEKLLSLPTVNITNDEKKANENLFKLIKHLELNEEMHYELKEYCNEKDIIFFSTVIDLDSLELLKKMKVPLIKIASCDLNNFPLLKEVAKSKIPVIISTGMAYLSEVDDTIRIFEEFNHKDLAILHCVSNYPPNISDLNLNNLITLSNCFEYPVGFSDHTIDLHFSLAAVAMGACIIERHFTLDHDMEGPDHKASLNPQQLKELVKKIREIEKAKGSFNKKPVEAEKKSIKIMRRSIVANIEIPNDTIINKDMIELKRPGTGLSPKYLDFIIGRRTNKTIHKDELILLSHLY